jgi:hypothetical protein
MFPSADNRIAIGRVMSNWAQIINIATNIGTLKNIPATPHTIPQNTRFIKIASVDKFNVLPVNFGSIILPNKICNPIKPTAVNIGCCNDGADTNEYKIGKLHAIIAPIVGI